MFAAKPDLAMVLTSWTWAPLTDLAVLLGTLGYAWLAHRASPASSGNHHDRWPVRRSVSWGLAILAFLLAGNSAVAVYSDVLFWVHMVQHLLLIMIAPILLVWAQPVRLVQTALPTVGVRLERLLARRPVRWATAPLTGLALYTALVVLTHLTGFQQVSATHGGVRAFELAAYLACGWLLFFPPLGGELGSWSLPYLLRFLVLALGMGADTLTGVALMLTSRPLAPAYAAAHPGWGPGALLDQEAAGRSRRTYFPVPSSARRPPARSRSGRAAPARSRPARRRASAPPSNPRRRASAHGPVRCAGSPVRCCPAVCCCRTPPRTSRESGIP